MYVLCMYYVKVPQLLEREKTHLEAALKDHALDSLEPNCCTASNWLKS